MPMSVLLAKRSTPTIFKPAACLYKVHPTSMQRSIGSSAIRTTSLDASASRILLSIRLGFTAWLAGQFQGEELEEPRVTRTPRSILPVRTGYTSFLPRSSRSRDSALRVSITSHIPPDTGRPFPPRRAFPVQTSANSLLDWSRSMGKDFPIPSLEVALTVLGSVPEH